MKPVKKEDVRGLNDIVMELPAFTDLKSKDQINEVLDLFLEDVYINQPQEIFDTFDFNLNDKMQETFFSNYGIDKSYIRKIKGYLKKDLAYQLERLFQNKGSKQIFTIFADVFENIFRNINFYNIKVHKIPTSTGFRFEYRLEPIYITDENNVLTYPQIPVEQTRKYLMELENFKDYTFWPMPTNLVYIQLSIGNEIINNMSTFGDGIRSYGTTYLQNKMFNYLSKDKFLEQIHAADVEFITSYFKVELTKKKAPDWDFNIPLIPGSYLPHDPNFDTEDRNTFLHAMQDFILEYGDAKRQDRQTMQDLRRRWQGFLRYKSRTNDCYNTYEEMYSVMEQKYPVLQQDFLYYLDLADTDNEPVFDFYVYLYSIFISGVFQQLEDPNEGFREDWTINYIDVLFGELFIEADFLKWYFNPVMDLFIRYFFPIEMEYINDLVPKVIIKDKWNSVSYDDSNLNMNIYSRKWSRETPIRGIDWRRFNINMYDKHSYIDDKDERSTTIFHPLLETFEMDESIYVEVQTLRRDEIPTSDDFDATILQGGGVLAGQDGEPLAGVTRAQRTSTCLKTSGTKEYLIGVLNASINK